MLNRCGLRCLTAFLLLGLLAFAGTGCDSKEEASVELVEPFEEARPTRPQDILAHTTAQDAVVSGLQKAVAISYRPARSTRNLDGDTEVPREVRENARHASVFFGANNHGERLDCGCKSNPLGGLARRHSLIDLAGASGEEAERWWSDSRSPTSALLVVDAGDAFFKSVTLGRSSEDHQAMARFDAETIANALAQRPPDVFNVGVNDLVFGLEFFEGLQKAAKLNVVSANLRHKESGERVFEPAARVEKAGTTFGVVGLTKEQPRIKGLWDELGVSVADSGESYRAAWDTVSDTDVVVLLSNLGIAESRSLLESLDETMLPTMVVASNTNRLTRRPEWVRGVPIVEPLSRGKYVGLADLYLNGDGRPTFTNIEVDSSRAMQNYRKAWSTYASASKRHNDALRDIQTHILNAAKEGEPAESEAERVTSRRAYLDGRVERSAKRVEIASTELQGALKSLLAAEKPVDTPGDDWFVSQIIPVKLDVPRAASTRTVVDAREKKRPSAGDPRTPSHR